ncbi:MAG: TIGR00730 family Rossman fold protein [Bacteroidota bacterium]|nr:TIGR00730 family Rossman fold protein [Bacteroidota bacterium]
MKTTNGYKEKTWSEVKADSSWSLFRIMGEFSQGYEKLNKIGPCVSIYGSARTKPDNKYYKYAVEIAEKLTQRGYGIITGGGPGIMEAANKGAKLGKGSSVGLNINLPHEQDWNDFIDRDKLINFDYFFVRKVMFVKYAQGFVVMPGGFGTLDEFFEAITLIQTNKINYFPVVLFGNHYWKGLIDWMKTTMLEEETNISKEDFDIFKIADSVDDTVQYIEDFYKTSRYEPNF